MSSSPQDAVLTQSGSSRGISIPRAVSTMALILVATFLAVYFRRPDQLFNPYIWVEDGTVNLPQYIAHGWLYLFEPVAGYLIVPSKLIQASALTLSVSYYPEIAYWLTLAFQAAVLATLALSPTSLRAPLLSALFTLIIPCDSEVFGTSLYAFWWGSLLIFPPLVWARNAEQILWPRTTMVMLGGLSSPLIVAFAPLFMLQALVVRTRNSILVACAGLLCAVVQAYFLFTTAQRGTTLPASVNIVEIVRKFFGMFVYWSPASTAALPNLGVVLGSALMFGILVTTTLARRDLGWRHFVLAFALCASIVVSVTRIPAEAMHPFIAGPRYFFYPYILLGWLVIELIMISRRQVALALCVPLLAGLHQFLAYGPRGHHAIDWRAHMAACRNAVGPYALPVHLTGNRDQAWIAMIPANGCRELDARSLLK